MSPAKAATPLAPAASRMLSRTTLLLGVRLHDARIARRLTLRELGSRAGLSAPAIHAVEAGRCASLETYQRLATAMNLELDISLTDAAQRRKDARDRANPRRDAADFVHAAMGEFEAQRFSSHHFAVAIDEPYQHYQFAGRADLLAWDLDTRALLQVENRTRFPDLQDAAGAWNAKRVYVPGIFAARVGVKGGWRSVTHAMVVLWSSEVLHTLRLRAATFRALCPDPSDAFAAWWMGKPPAEGVRATLVILDPCSAGRQRVFVGLDGARRVEPRHRGYAEAAECLRSRHR